jgi:hypothetical protein
VARQIIAPVGGAATPNERPIDRADQTNFFLGKKEKCNREGFPAYVAGRLAAVKWRNWKMHLTEQVDSAVKLEKPTEEGALAIDRGQIKPSEPDKRNI